MCSITSGEHGAEPSYFSASDASTGDSDTGVGGAIAGAGRRRGDAGAAGARGGGGAIAAAGAAARGRAGGGRGGGRRRDAARARQILLLDGGGAAPERLGICSGARRAPRRARRRPKHRGGARRRDDAGRHLVVLRLRGAAAVGGDGGGGGAAREVADGGGVAQRVERLLDRVGARRDVADHQRVRVADERLAEDLGELRAAERDVRLPEVERADALLEREQRLVDLGALELALLVGAVERVAAALRPREVDEREPAGDGVGLFLGGGAEDELEDGVRAARLVVDAGDGGRARVARLEERLVELGVRSRRHLRPARRRSPSSCRPRGRGGRTAH